MENKGLTSNITSLSRKDPARSFDALVLDKDIFSNVFEKDIRRIYLYKKSERIAKALHLITPALKDARSLKERTERIALGLIDASLAPSSEARSAVSRELLALSSVLSMARASGYLSSMNTDIIMREAHMLLQEVASYETPHITLDDPMSIAAISRLAPKEKSSSEVRTSSMPIKDSVSKMNVTSSKGHVSDNHKKSVRRDEILSIVKTKGPAYIKDISTLIRGVSEKTIQRELQVLVASGKVQREGERRWTTYSVPAEKA